MFLGLEVSRLAPKWPLGDPGSPSWAHEAALEALRSDMGAGWLPGWPTGHPRILTAGLDDGLMVCRLPVRDGAHFENADFVSFFNIKSLNAQK